MSAPNTSGLSTLDPNEPPDEPTTGRLWRGREARGPSIFTPFSAVLAAFIVALVLYPVSRTLLRAFYRDGQLDLSAFSQTLGADWLPQVFLNTIIAVGAGGFLALVTAASFAWLNERTDARLGVVGDLLPLVPLLLPAIALSIGWVFLGSSDIGFLNVWLQKTIGRIGIDFQVNISSWAGLIFVYALYFVPYVYLLVSASLRNVDASLEEASRLSGAGMGRTLRKISLPSVRPALWGSILLIVMVGMSLYSVPVIIATRAGIDILSVRIIRALTYSYPARPDEAIALSLILLVMIATVWAIDRRVSAGGHFAQISGKGGRGALVELGRWRWVARGVMILYLISTSILPMLALLIVATQTYWTPEITFSELGLHHFRDVLFETRQTRSAIRFSLTLGVVGGLVGITIAAILAIFTKRRGGFVGRAVDGVTKMPAAFSNIVIAVGFLIAFSGPPLRLSGTLLILLLVYIVIYLPQASIAAGTALSQVGGELSEASAVAGASDGRTFRKVVAPLILPGMTAGWALLFVLMAGELTASALLAGLRYPVVGFVLLDIWEAGRFGPLAALAFTIAALTSTVMLVVFVVSRRRSKIGR